MRIINKQGRYERLLIILGVLILLLDLLYNLSYKPNSFDYINRTAIVLGFSCVLFGVEYEKILMIFSKINKLFETKTYHVLFTILIVSILIRLLFLPERWINPDEGAHLYDAKFVLDGKIPIVDYDSRMPVYVYTIAAFLKVFGISYMLGRLLPLFSNIGIGILVFLIGNKLFNSRKVALLASAIYLFSPLSILWSVVVKTELFETFFVSIGMLLLLTYIKLEKEKYNIIFFSGFFFALAYYVRRSAFVILIASLLFVIYFYKANIYKVVKTYGIMLLGYFSVVFLIFVYFSSFMGFAATWESRLNPLDTVMDPIQKIKNNLKQDGSVVSENTNFRLNDQPYSATIEQWKTTLKLNFFLVISIILSISIFIYYFAKRAYNSTFHEIQLPYLFVYCWFFAMLMFYIYYTAQRGFFNPYFGELLPPMAIITSHIIFFIISNKQFQDKLKIFILIILFTTFLSSISYVNPSFDSVWSPQTVKEVSQYLIINSDGETEVMSGAVIWSFESNTKPFLNITHPLAYRPEGISDKKIEKFEKRLQNDPPRFIILDGYTEQTYLKHISNIQDSINESYSLEKEVNGSRYPVKIYGLKNKGDVDI